MRVCSCGALYRPSHSFSELSPDEQVKEEMSKIEEVYSQHLTVFPLDWNDVGQVSQIKEVVYQGDSQTILPLRESAVLPSDTPLRTSLQAARAVAVAKQCAQPHERPTS